MELIINGAAKELQAETLADVVEQLGLTGKPVVAEADGLVVTSEAWSQTAVRPGMRIELVHFVGGG
ncbi:sulfur carrier protein ThiS [Paenibacillus physcomitrellae]|uniref:Thiamine biosynthesis protein ThiS n=1 Tax=Paenibacillus physcomitrellae TaxID=1619311 RepID=A0ABQ1GNZ1_9BACL|nr:sulfur carrier protein ThiS [Paenibacillus physcomitrellae]GGA47609.1 hypothetical protein GCM10010917_36120 [Paenibacillus physcomitrellae]